MTLEMRNVKRSRKIAEWENRIETLHNKYPRLGQISGLFSELALELALLDLGRAKLGMPREEILKAQEALQAEKQTIIREYGLPGNIYEVWWDCEKCRDTGFTNIGEKCSCLLQEELQERWQSSGLSPQQKAQTFSSFSLEWYKDKERYRNILQITLDFAENLASKCGQGKNLLLCGPVGTGKTHLCSAIANYVLQSGVNVVYLKISKLLDMIRENKYKSDDDKYRENIRRLEAAYHVGLLIIDDLGTETLTDFAREQLFLILDERINHRLPWVISTNLLPNVIESHYGDRISDRLVCNSTILKFTGESVRQRKSVIHQIKSDAASEK